MSLDNAIAIAISMESTEKQQKLLKGEEQAIYKVKSSKSDEQKLRCYRCNRSNHLAPECFFKDHVCKICEKEGHLKSVCRNQKGTAQNYKNKKSNNTNLVEYESDKEDTQIFFKLLKVLIKNFLLK